MSAVKFNKIAIGHKSRSGKDTIADYLIAKFGFRRLSMAAPVYEIGALYQKIAQVETHKDAALLQSIGQFGRNYFGDDIWIKYALASDTAILNDRLVVSDLRYRNEMRLLKENGFITIKVVRDDRPIDRDPNHPSEVDLDDAEFDYTVVNCGTIDELYEKINNIISLV